MIDLRKMNNKELALFEKRIVAGFYEKGVVIAYHEGNFSDEVNFTREGSAMWRASELGRVDLFQKKLGDERFLYLGVVK